MKSLQSYFWTENIPLRIGSYASIYIKNMGDRRVSEGDSKAET